MTEAYLPTFLIVVLVHYLKASSLTPHFASIHPPPSLHVWLFLGFVYTFIVAVISLPVVASFEAVEFKCTSISLFTLSEAKSGNRDKSPSIFYLKNTSNVLLSLTVMFHRLLIVNFNNRQALRCLYTRHCYKH